MFLERDFDALACKPEEPARKSRQLCHFLLVMLRLESKLENKEYSSSPCFLQSTMTVVLQLTVFCRTFFHNYQQGFERPGRFFCTDTQSALINGVLSRTLLSIAKVPLPTLLDFYSTEIMTSFFSLSIAIYPQINVPALLETFFLPSHLSTLPSSLSLHSTLELYKRLPSIHSGFAKTR